MGIVYRIFNTTNGKSYIGQTWGLLDERWSAHQDPNSSCRKLRNAIKKYGKNVFDLSILCILDNQKELDLAEDYWIEFFDCINDGYNLRRGGSRGKLSKETIELMKKPKSSIAITHMRESQGSQEMRERKRIAQLGKKHSQERIEKSRLARLGKKRTEQQRENISRGMQGYVPTEKHKQNVSIAVKKWWEERRGRVS